MRTSCSRLLTRLVFVLSFFRLAFTQQYGESVLGYLSSTVPYSPGLLCATFDTGRFALSLCQDVTQEFQFDPYLGASGEGLYIIRPNTSPASCLTGRQVGEAGQVVLEKCTSSSDQLWNIVSQSPPMLKNFFLSGQCLSVSNTSSPLFSPVALTRFCDTLDASIIFTFAVVSSDAPLPPLGPWCSLVLANNEILRLPSTVELGSELTVEMYSRLDSSPASCTQILDVANINTSSSIRLDYCTSFPSIDFTISPLGDPSTTTGIYSPPTNTWIQFALVCSLSVTGTVCALKADSETVITKSYGGRLSRSTYADLYIGANAEHVGEVGMYPSPPLSLRSFRIWDSALSDSTLAMVRNATIFGPQTELAAAYYWSDQSCSLLNSAFTPSPTPSPSPTSTLSSTSAPTPPPIITAQLITRTPSVTRGSDNIVGTTSPEPPPVVIGGGGGSSISGALIGGIVAGVVVGAALFIVVCLFVVRHKPQSSVVDPYVSTAQTPPDTGTLKISGTTPRNIPAHAPIAAASAPVVASSAPDVAFSALDLAPGAASEPIAPTVPTIPAGVDRIEHETAPTLPEIAPGSPRPAPSSLDIISEPQETSTGHASGPIVIA